MTNAIEGKRVAQPRSLKLVCPHPPPVVARRPAMPAEIPGAAMSFLRAAVRAQWAVKAFYALGWRVDSGAHLTGELRASVLLQMSRGEERACALWSTPWPIPPGIEPPGLDTPPELPAHLPRVGMAEKVAALRAQRLAMLKTNPAVKWVFELGAYWVRPATPLSVVTGGGKTGWWSATELRAKVTAPAG